MSAFSLIRRKLHNLTHPELGQILMLHRVTEQRSRLVENRKIEVTPDFLEQTIIDYRQRGYRTASIDEAAETLKKGKTEKPFVCFTFDDGYADNYTLAFPIFKKYNCPFTINITTDFYERKALLWWYVLEDLGVTDEEFSTLREEIFKLKNSEIEPFFEKRFPQGNYSFEQKVSQMALSAEQIKTLSDSGLCTIGNHTVSHPNLTALSSAEQERQILEAQKKLEALTDKPVRHFAFPYGLYDNDTLRILERNDTVTATKTWGGKIRRGDNRLLLNRMELREE